MTIEWENLKSLNSTAETGHLISTRALLVNDNFETVESIDPAILRKPFEGFLVRGIIESLARFSMQNYGLSIRELCFLTQWRYESVTKELYRLTKRNGLGKYITQTMDKDKGCSRYLLDKIVAQQYSNVELFHQFHVKDTGFTPKTVHPNIKQKKNYKGPNKEEQSLYDVLNILFPNKYDFVGNSSFDEVDGKRPDFINKNKTKVIEYNGIYWHTGEFIEEDSRDEHEQNRINHYKNNNIECLVIWSDDFETDREKINKQLVEFGC